jgi:4-hydroxy-3-polyprenylbenzoate decarboxylase
VHAVDASGVHPLLLAIGSERYTPYAKPGRPAELLTQACAILGQGQMSLAKYLIIAACDDDERLDIHDIPAFFQHVLRRVDWRRDLHFHTRTTIDTLDYSGSGLNEGSKLVIAASGPPLRELPTELPRDLNLPDGLRDPRLVMPGLLVVAADSSRSGEAIASAFDTNDSINRFPLLVLVDESEFAARTLNNFLWTTFTRSNPAADVHGIGAFSEQKHWGCNGSLLIDARSKPHHAPPLVEDPSTTAKVDALAARGGPLAKWL